ncbi:hypothetical protein [Pelagibaculum spongiae]|uniref:GIY-YIG domain-containing protein n=1 Tax=Pelagibaculum spongiae TaxID=2080658 RepID=A0A2V1H236_9GAMM|nr:hypothetical protein [Pelagibaculum spongiae]PVZ72603.1 hypothetical protein DC094_03365 [Pelagibaculum spongiae]
MSDRSAVFRYLFHERYNSDKAKLADITGFTIRQIDDWLKGNKIPQKKSLDFIAVCSYTPEFKVVAEFYKIDPNKQIRPQLKEMYNGHENRSGIYAFYDSMANLLYIGKAKNLLEETYSAIRRDDEIRFPSGIKNSKTKRFELIKYISAYDVKSFNFWDYPKHVESLLLRISKPPLNKQIGTLESAIPAESE